MAGSNLTIFCRIVAEGTVECNGTNYYLPEEPLSYRDTWFWLFLAIYVALVLFAGKPLNYMYDVPLVLIVLIPGRYAYIRPYKAHRYVLNWCMAVTTYTECDL